MGDVGISANPGLSEKLRVPLPEALSGAGDASGLMLQPAGWLIYHDEQV